MSVKEILSLNGGGSASMEKQTGSKRRRFSFSKRFSFQEISLRRSPGKSSLRDENSDELKAKIMRWAKAVVAYARQVSGKFGSSGRADDGGSKSAGSCSRVHDGNNTSQQ